jgi:short subunit dehydrogenase-like uncharacterized protein
LYQTIENEKKGEGGVPCPSSKKRGKGHYTVYTETKTETGEQEKPSLVQSRAKI